jgi:hypothetical protein
LRSARSFKRCSRRCCRADRGRAHRYLATRAGDRGYRPRPRWFGRQRELAEARAEIKPLRRRYRRRAQTTSGASGTGGEPGDDGLAGAARRHARHDLAVSRCTGRAMAGCYGAGTSACTQITLLRHANGMSATNKPAPGIERILTASRASG